MRKCPGWGGRECGNDLEKFKRLCEDCRQRSRAATKRRARRTVTVVQPPGDRRLMVRAARPDRVWAVWAPDGPEPPPGVIAAEVVDGDATVAVAIATPIGDHTVEISVASLTDLRPYVPEIYTAAAELLDLLPRLPRVQAHAYTERDRRFAERLGFVTEGKMRRARRNDDGTFADAWLMRLEEAE